MLGCCGSGSRLELFWAGFAGCTESKAEIGYGTFLRRFLSPRGSFIYADETDADFFPR